MVVARSCPVNGFVRGLAALRCILSRDLGSRRMEKQGRIVSQRFAGLLAPRTSGQAVASCIDLSKLECDVALEAAMHSDDEEWID